MAAATRKGGGRHHLIDDDAGQRHGSSMPEQRILALATLRTLYASISRTKSATSASSVTAGLVYDGSRHRRVNDRPGSPKAVSVLRRRIILVI